MGKISIQELAATLIERNGLNKKEANTFISTFFDLVQQALETDKMVKVKGLGTFKIIDVDDRESVNVNTGERVLIEGHGKITFTPDPIMKELVNKPFSQFETVVLNEGVDFEDIPPELSVAVEEAVIPVSRLEPLREDPQPVTREEPLTMPLVDFVDEIREEDKDIPERVIEPVISPDTKVMQKPAPNPEPEPESAPEPESEPVSESGPTHEPEPAALEEEENTESEDEYEEGEDERSGVGKWLIALLAFILGLIGGYFVGNYSSQTNYLSLEEVKVEKPTPAPKTVVAPVKKEVPTVKPEQVPEAEVPETTTSEAETPKVETLEAETPKAETPKAETPKAETPKAVVSEPAPVDFDKYSKMDPRVRTGAYRIVGTAKVVKAKGGENLLKISRSILGPDMECYLEVYNGIKATTVLKPGQEIKIPKLQWKMKKKPRTVK